MKKVVFIVFMMIFGVVLIACNSNPSEVEVNYDEQIDIPTNLRIEGKTLSWDNVEKAKGYFVFANGEEVAKVRTNSYDFGKISGDRIIFTVVTIAPRGMQDSTKSVSLAYMANRDNEIIQMKSVISAKKLPLSDEFAQELVDKGMTSQEFGTMIDDVIATVGLTSDLAMENIFSMATEVMDSVVNPEALISASVKFLLPQSVESSIAANDLMIDYYENFIKNNPYNHDYYQDQIDSLSNENEMYTNLLNMLDENIDHAVKSFAFVIDYFMTIQELLAEDILGLLTDMGELDGLSDLNVNEILLVKEEIASVLKETMPKQSDLIVVIETYLSMMNILDVEEVNIDLSGVSSEKTAGLLLMQLEAFIKYLETIDLEYFQRLKTLGNQDLSEYMMIAETQILAIKYFTEFKDNNQDLLDAISEVYSETEKEQIFSNNIDMFDSYLSSLGYSGTTDVEISFEDYLELEVIFKDTFSDFLAAFVASDGEVLRAQARIAENQSSNYYFDYDPIENEVNIAKFMNEIVFLMDATVGEWTKSEYEDVMKFMTDIYYLSVISMFAIQNSEDPNHFGDVIDDIDILMNETLNSHYNLLINLLAYLSSDDLLNDFADYYGEVVRDLRQERPGINYQDIAMLLFFSEHYLSFMNNTNRAYADNIVERMAFMFAKDSFADLEAPDNFESLVKELMDYLTNNLGQFSSYDGLNLTSQQIANIEEFFEGIEEIFE
jgi:hypothetical protein